MSRLLLTFFIKEQHMTNKDLAKEKMRAAYSEFIQSNSLDTLIENYNFYKGFTQALAYADIISSAECDSEWLSASHTYEDLRLS